ncbi:MAG TPA: LptE family protein [bacterium]|nr:LptE family protein [bacterium]HPR88439.1 LptE family protein [bacterium]
MIKKGLILLPLLGLAAGCGIYSVKGSMAPHLKTVAIPLFDNRTAEFRVAEDLTDAIIGAFTSDNSLKIAERNAADVLIEGSIIQIDDRAGAFDSGENVQDMKLYLSVQIKCTDQVKREVLWQERLTHFGSYDPSGGPEARTEALTEAMQKVSEEVLNKTVANW